MNNDNIEADERESYNKLLCEVRERNRPKYAQ